MLFTVLPVGVRVPHSARQIAFLTSDNWDDWFEFSTLFYLTYIDESGGRHDIGQTKVGRFGMRRGQRSAELPASFDELDQTYFSLGQDDSFYENLNGLGDGLRLKILSGLKDFAWDLSLFDRALRERVTGISLLRSVTPATVRGQFHRLANGGVRLSRFEFAYAPPGKASENEENSRLQFDVEPESHPPTNIHVLIGRNGVGKTHLLNLMTRALVEEDAEASKVGKFTSARNRPQSTLFANLVSVSFSAFDRFEPLPTKRDKSGMVQYSYVGLKRVGLGPSGKPFPPKSPGRLAAEFSSSVDLCHQGARAVRWKRALRVLEADPIFQDAEVAYIASIADRDEMKKVASRTFSKLSSGHKIVLLTATKLVELVEERTLVLLDEPEAHLHPPLLSAFVRALSELLIDRNGVAIIATHSPVVLQEVPRSCAWKVRRFGRELVIERPEIETFGESVGILTREVFGLEVTQSGFHRMLRESVEQGGEYDDVVARFGGELGAEAKALVQALIAARNSEEGL